MEEKKKHKYIIEESLYTENLEERVSEMMNDGYVPHGSMIMGKKSGDTNTSFFQPMILKEEKKEVL